MPDHPAGRMQESSMCLQQKKSEGPLMHGWCRELMWLNFQQLFSPVGTDALTPVHAHVLCVLQELGGDVLGVLLPEASVTAYTSCQPPGTRVHRPCFNGSTGR
jgi:hypothetical protein